MTYQPKVYKKQGGAEMVVASGGTLTLESGSTLTIASGASISDSSISGNVAVAAATLAIPVTHAHVSKTTGGAEALTLANGTTGQILTITHTNTTKRSDSITRTVLQ